MALDVVVEVAVGEVVAVAVGVGVAAGVAVDSASSSSSWKPMRGEKVTETLRGPFIVSVQVVRAPRWLQAPPQRILESNAVAVIVTLVPATRE